MEVRLACCQWRSRQTRYATQDVDCKTVDRIFAYSSTHEQSNKRSGTRLKTESETWGENAFSDFFTDFEKKTTVLQSTFVRAQIFTISKLVPGVVNR